MKYIITIMASMFLFANIAHGENNYVRENVNAYLTHHYKWETLHPNTGKPFHQIYHLVYEQLALEFLYELHNGMLSYP